MLKAVDPETLAAAVGGAIAIAGNVVALVMAAIEANYRSRRERRWALEDEVRAEAILPYSPIASNSSSSFPTTQRGSGAVWAYSPNSLILVASMTLASCPTLVTPFRKSRL